MKCPNKFIYASIIFLAISISALALDVEMLTTDMQSNSGEPVDVIVRVTNNSNNSTPMDNTLVNFTTTFGMLNSSSAYTDILGIAKIQINSTLAGTAQVNASSGTSYNLTNITFLPLTASSILVDVDYPVNVAGNVTNITFTPVDIFGNTNSSEAIYLEINITDYSDIVEVPSKEFVIYPDNITSLYVNRTAIESNLTSASGSAFLSLNSTVAGNITVTASIGSVQNQTKLLVLPGEPSRIRPVYNEEYTVNTTSSMYTRIYDIYANPVPGVNLTFTVTPPASTAYNSPAEYNSASLSYPAGSTDTNGQFANVFLTDKRAGANIITIAVDNTSLQRNITINGVADEIDALLLSRTPAADALANNKDIYTLSARPVDQFLNPILPTGTHTKDLIRFTTTSGSMVLVPLNNQGQASTLIGPTPYIESLYVTATYKNATSYTSFTNSTPLYFRRGPLYTFDIYSNPNAVLAQGLNGNHEATVFLVALDEWGHTLPGVSFTLNNTNTTVGTLTMEGVNDTDLINSVTDSNGRIQALFIGNLSGNATLIATSGSINASTNISVKSKPFMSVNLTVSPTNVTSGGIVNVTTIISIEGELPIIRPAASAMLVLDRSGSMDPDYYAGTPLDVVLVIDRSGSMGPKHYNAMLDAKEAAKEFASNLASNSQLGVVSFAWDPYVASSIDLELTPLNSSANFLLVNKAIDKLHAVGGTAMGEGMADANDMLIYNGRSDSHKVMIILTDGETNRGTDQEGSNAVSLANANGITIYTIGLGSEINEALLRSIASDTGGKYYSAPSSSDLASIYNAIAQDICDYDINDIEYGEEGFTPYSYIFSDSISIEDTYTLNFEGYDFDDVFDASPYYGSTSAGECLIEVNGDNLGLLPSVRTTSNSNQWKSFSYDITDYVHSGENSLSFYDYYDYTGYKDYYNYYGYSYWWSSEIGNNWVKNIVVKHNGNTIQSYSTSTLLNGNGYMLSFDAPLSNDYFEDTFEINESLDDLKVGLQWEHEYANLDLQLVSPSGRVYGIGYDTMGYYPGSDGKSEYIWIHPLSGLYKDDEDAIETGTWTVRVTGISNGGTGIWQEDFTISTYIDKKSAVKMSSHAFISSFDETRGDKAGLALYSFEDIVQSSSQTSYIFDNGTWTGYFTVPSTAMYNFDVSWDDLSDVSAYLYEGTDLLGSSAGVSTCEVSSLLPSGETYRLDIVKGAGSLTDTRFTVNVSTSPLSTVMTAYYDSSGGSGTPRYRTWDGSDWSSEESANYVEARTDSLVLESNPLNSEFILGTGNMYYQSWGNSRYNLNIQVWNGFSWSSETQFTDGLSPYATRAFDLKYEQKSGDAIVVYGDGYWHWWWGYIGDSAPSYRIWNGSSWSSEYTVDGNNFGDGDISWIRLEANPNSNEMVLVTLDDEKDMRAQIWDGSSWSNQTTLTNNAVTSSYQCFDVMYQQGTGHAMVVWADSSHIKYRIWNGNSWGSTENLYSTSSAYWLKLTADPNSNKIILAYQDSSNAVYAFSWSGSFWSSRELIETNTGSNSRRSMDVAFEQSNGRALIVWGDRTSVPKYRIWNGTWESELLASNIGSTTRWVQLTPDPASDEIFLMTSDSGDDLNIQKWDGSSWAALTEVEASSSSTYECFDIVFNHQDNFEGTEWPSWSQWTASVASTLQNDSISHLSNAIDTMTADGLTAIDEGLFVANNELALVEGNSTIVIMTDGIDNAGYHSLLEEAYRAKANNTVIYTVGFGNSESEVDPVLEEIAAITGGEYYFAPNSSVLEEIFKGIAMQITNFSAGGPELSIHVPYNYVSPTSVAKVTYMPGSSNATTGDMTLFDIPIAPGIGNSEPTITTSGTTSVFEWTLPTMGPGDKWGIWYQMKVQGAGYVPLIMPTSTITYTDLSGENITIYIPGSGSAAIEGGGGLSLLTYSLAELLVVPDSPVLTIGESTNITVTVKDTLGNRTYAYVLLYSSLGSFDNYEHSNVNPINITVIEDESLNFMSPVAGKAYITAYAYNPFNESNALNESELILVRPKGMITIS